MSLLRLRMEAKGTAIMREVALPEDFTLAFLHAAIQSVFGWLDCHLHEFTDSKGMRYGDRDGEPPDDGGPYSFDDDFPMKKFFRKPGDRLEYEYDFGDMNEVSISLVGRTTAARRAHFLSQGPDMNGRRCRKTEAWKAKRKTADCHLAFRCISEKYRTGNS